MAVQGDSEDYRRFLQQPSTNMDDSGFFSVQVISNALSVWGLELIQYSSSDPLAMRVRESPLAANAYICNYREHWFTIRRLGSQWFNLNSLLEYPELVSNTYLGEFLAQLRQEGYSIFIVKGNLPECDADLILQAVPAVQHTRPRLLADVQSSGAQGARSRELPAARTPSSGTGTNQPSTGGGGSSSATRDEEADLEAAMMLSLAENFPGSQGGPATIDNSQLQAALGRGDDAMDEEMEMAIAMSQAEAQQPRQVPQESEEDELQKAISMSLAAAAGQGQVHQPAAAATSGGASGPSGSGPAGWGARLAEQEAEEEQLYLAEQARQQNEEEEQLRKALAMSMEDDRKAEAPIVNVDGVLKHKKLTCPTGERMDSKKVPSASSSVAGPSQANPGPSAASPTKKLSASGSPSKSNPLPAAPPAKPLPPSPSRPSLQAALSAGSSQAQSPGSGPGPSGQAAAAAMPDAGGHTLGGARRPPTESVTDKVTEDNNNITKDDKVTTDTSDHIDVVEDGNSSTLHDSIMQHLDKEPAKSQVELNDNVSSPSTAERKPPVRKNGHVNHAMDQANDGTNHHANGEHHHHHHLDLGELGHDMGLVLLPHMIKDPMLADPHIPQEERKSSINKGEMEEDIPERGNWTGKLDFLLSCLGYAVGLGNVWRFPYLCFKYGGGAFLVPYFLMLLFIGFPCFLLELTIGQYSAMGPVTVYSNISPMFKGLGIANFVAQSFVGLYYNMIIGMNCTNEPAFLNDIMSNKALWYKHTKELKHPNETTYKADCWYTNATFCNENATEASILKPFDLPVGKRDSSSSQYLKISVLKEAASIEPEHFGTPDWALALSLLCAWIIIFLCLVKGIKSSGKVVYVTATFPYLVLIILLIRAVTLDGASDGIYFYLVPDTTKLANIEVWVAAAGQIFFSLSVAGGGLITLASYNQFNNNILRDTLIVCIGNCSTSFVAGFAIFSVLGFMAKQIGLDVEDVATSGTGLAFVAYPDLVTKLPLPTLWAILFFLMLFTLGLDSQFAIVETILTGVLDYQPKLRNKKMYVVAGVCIVGFICGLPLTCPGGGYLLDLLDNYAAVWPYLFIGATELILLSWVYGYSNFIDDLVEMTNATWLNNKYVKYFLATFYMVVSPLIIVVILLIDWASYKPFTKGDYEYPGWANGIGWFIAMFCILSVPIVMIIYVVMKWFNSGQPTDKDGSMDVLEESYRHTNEWRANAFKAYERGETTADFGYEALANGRLIRRRGADIRTGGIDNKGWRKSADLTSL